MSFRCSRRSSSVRRVVGMFFACVFGAASLQGPPAHAVAATDDTDEVEELAAEAVSAETRERLQVDLAAVDAAQQFYFSDPTAWEVVEVAGERALELKGTGKYRPPHRSPLSIALLKAPVFTDVTVTAELQQTGREYGHRDLCLFFGFASKDRFYYTHLATTPDANAHNIFLVDGAARRNLLPPQEKGVDWGTDVRHRVRLERLAATGRIRVYFDDMDMPILEVTDQTIGAGRVGFGSFDDTGKFSRIVVEGVVEGAVESEVPRAVGVDPIGNVKAPPIAPPVAPPKGEGDDTSRNVAEPEPAPAPRVVSRGNPFEG